MPRAIPAASLGISTPRRTPRQSGILAAPPGPQKPADRRNLSLGTASGRPGERAYPQRRSSDPCRQPGLSVDPGRAVRTGANPERTIEAAGLARGVPPHYDVARGASKAARDGAVTPRNRRARVVRILARPEVRERVPG